MRSPMRPLGMPPGPATGAGPGRNGAAGGNACHRAQAARGWSRGSGNRRGRGRRALALLLLALLPAGGCCLVRPPDAKTLVAAGSAGWRTPEAAFETFRVAFGAVLPELEYRSFSRGFRRREGISYQTYLVARERLLAGNPLLKLLAGAEVVESRVLVEGRSHLLVIQAAGRRFAVELVGEDRFQIYAGADFLADGPVDFERALTFREAPGGVRPRLDLLLSEEDLAGVDLSRATSFLIEKTWKIDRFGEPPKP